MLHLNYADLFCGGGGTTNGAKEAIQAAGFKPIGTAINHWPTAIATHKLNHPNEHHLCTSVDDVNPRSLYKPGELHLLWASPECTHHSRARGGKPMSEQSRATAHCVTRWAEALLPNIIMVENVPEFIDWGPLMRVRRLCKEKVPAITKEHWRKDHPKIPRSKLRKHWWKHSPKKVVKIMRYVWVPNPKYKGQTFLAWKSMLESLGYKVAWKILCAADYGDPTTRQRLFVQCVRGKRKIVWPDRTHAPVQELNALRQTKQTDLFATNDHKLRPWRSARECIDWSLEGRFLDEMKGKKQYDGLPLSPKTLARIYAGLQRFGIRPYILPKESGVNRSHSVDRPLKTLTCESRGEALLQPIIVTIDQQSSPSGAQPITEPLSTAVTKQRHAIAEPSLEPLIVKTRGTTKAHVKSAAKLASEPLDSVTTSGKHHSVIQPFLVDLHGTSDSSIASTSKPLTEPLPTVSGGGHQSLIDGVLVPTAFGERKGQQPRAHSLGEPMSSVVGSQTHGLASVEVSPYLVETAHGESGGLRAHSIEEPLKAVCGERGSMALLEPQLLPQQSGGALRAVSEPVPTVATDGAIGFIQPEIPDPITLKPGDELKPYLVKFYNTATGQYIDDPLDTVTTKERFALVVPVIEVDGKVFRIRLRWRMLQAHELQLAQGFPKNYRFSGNKTEAVKQIGNAVPRHLARALVYAVLTQNPDVSALWEMSFAE